MVDANGSYLLTTNNSAPAWMSGRRASTSPVAVSNFINPVAMPVGDVVQGARKYVQVFAEDFNTDVAIGGFIPKQNDPSSGLLLNTGAAYTPYGSKVMVYPSGFGAGSTGKSRPEKVLSVENSCLTHNFSIDAATGEYLCATVHFIVGSDVYNGGTPGYNMDPTKGGRYMFRFMVENGPQLAGWGAVSQLIASSADWSANHGEMDMNEGSVSLGMETNQHWYGPTNNFTRWNTQPWGNNVWHNTCYDFIPVGDPLEPAGRETVWIDGIKVGESIGDRINQNWRAFFAFQTGANATPPPAAGQLDSTGTPFPANGVTRGKLKLDWATVHLPVAA